MALWKLYWRGEFSCSKPVIRSADHYRHTDKLLDPGGVICV
jgi:hypothetical protein